MVDFKELYLGILSKITDKPDSKNDISDNNLEEIEEKLGITLPKALREYCLIESEGFINRESDSDSEIDLINPYFMGSHYDKILMEDLKEELEEERKNVPIVLIIAEHCQGSCYWGIDVKKLKEEDPPILYYNPDKGEREWERTGLKCSEFICFMIYYLISDGRGIFSAVILNSIDKKLLNKIEDNYPLLYDHIDWKIYAKDGQVLKYDNDFLWVSAKTETDKLEICKKLHLKWEKCKDDFGFDDLIILED
ncbi:MAG: SMI1/KNR4 family protein [Promethearchaeota archaeon]